MILILLNIKDLKSINFPLLKPLSNRTGTSFWSTIYGNTANLSNRFSVAMENTFPQIPHVPCVGLHITTSMITMAETANTSAKSVDKHFVLGKLLLHLSDLPVLIVAIPWLPKKTVNSSVFINVSTLSALTTFIILTMFQMRNVIPKAQSVNINFIISTVNSP